VVRVLGVDPGLTRCGLGVIDGDAGRRVSCVAVTVVRTSPDVELGRRLSTLAATVEGWLDEHGPDVVAVERVFSQHKVALPMRERAGVARNTTWGRAASSDVEG